MVKIVYFVLHVFYHNKENEKGQYQAELYNSYHKFSWKIQSLTKCQVKVGGQKYSYFKSITKFTFITKTKRGNIFSDNWHVFGVVDSELIWEQRYFLTSSSTPVKTIDNKYKNYLMP